MSTYTNTDNHPSVIKFVAKVKVNQRMKIDLHKQYKVPIDGLNGLIPIAEEIDVKKKEKKIKSKNAFEEESSDEEQEEAAKASGEESDGGAEALNPKKVAKKLLKAERRDKRK